jgi:probable phosphoglycerate mutase
MRHTLRGNNKTADRLANEAMDRGMGKSALPTVGKPATFEAARLQAAQPAIPRRDESITALAGNSPDPHYPAATPPAKSSKATSKTA